MRNNDFDEIYALCHDRIVKYLRRAVGSEEAEDCAQETFLKVVSSLGTFRNESSMYTWVYRIATNVVIDRKRRQTAVDRCCLADRALFCKAEPDYLSAEFDIVQREMNECICSYLKALPSPYRVILVLKEYEGFSVAEISDILRISPENAKRRLSRARARLKKLLLDQCAFYYNELNQLSCEKKT
jgi:RNA polymerase sigma-70 factor, ECF subfamily